MPGRQQLSPAASRTAEDVTRSALRARLGAMPGKPAAHKPVKAPLPRMSAADREANYRLAHPRKAHLTGRQRRRIAHKARVPHGSR